MNYLTHKHQTSTSCSQGPVNSNDTNVVETSNCLETTQQKKDKFHCLITDQMTLVQVQLYLRVLKAATVMETDCEFERSWGILSTNLSKRSFAKGADNGVWIYPRICLDGHFITSSVNK